MGVDLFVVVKLIFCCRPATEFQPWKNESIESEMTGIEESIEMVEGRGVPVIPVGHATRLWTEAAVAMSTWRV
jgi:hypothetical protein